MVLRCLRGEMRIEILSRPIHIRCAAVGGNWTGVKDLHDCGRGSSSSTRSAAFAAEVSPCRRLDRALNRRPFGINGNSYRCAGSCRPECTHAGIGGEEHHPSTAVRGNQQRQGSPGLLRPLCRWDDEAASQGRLCTPSGVRSNAISQTVISVGIALDQNDPDILKLSGDRRLLWVFYNGHSNLT